MRIILFFISKTVADVELILAVKEPGNILRKENALTWLKVQIFIQKLSEKSSRTRAARNKKRIMSERNSVEFMELLLGL